MSGKLRSASSRHLLVYAAFPLLCASAPKGHNEFIGLGVAHARARARRAEARRENLADSFLSWLLRATLSSSQKLALSSPKPSSSLAKSFIAFCPPQYESAEAGNQHQALIFFQLFLVEPLSATSTLFFSFTPAVSLRGTSTPLGKPRIHQERDVLVNC